MSPADRWPTLYHVTDRSAVPAIERFGLMSAVGLCALFAPTPTVQAQLLAENRDCYHTHYHPAYGQTTLPPGRRRLRCYDDDQPLAEAACLREVAVRDGIPPGIAFSFTA